ncbi:c-type cytochrome domain-containing protein [Prosthecobacter sp. SYSU 5D2]|uniref:c-type cytochrome domain-containing protein n=1 Tax=Prosthecobacter sp. SYSU 5D2 TaxID=3134134 RepID=UPI0031FEAC16
MNTKLTLAAIAAVFAVSTASAQEGAVDFEKQILPVLKEQCFSCHEKEKEVDGRMKKPKGGLRLDGAAHIMKGGKEYPEENVVAGKPDASWLLKTMALPDTDEYAMPPEGKGDRVSAENQALIKKWIESGASFGSWKGVED